MAPRRVKKVVETTCNVHPSRKQRRLGKCCQKLVQKCVFAKANVAALDSQDYGRSLGVRMNVPITPTIRMYWRWGRGEKIGPPESSKNFSWIPEDYPVEAVKLLGTLLCQGCNLSLTIHL